MKKIIATVIIFAVLVSACIFGGASVSAASAEDFFVYDGVLVEYVGNGGDVVIPDNLGIKEIGEKAFYNCSSLTSVTIEDSVTEIEWDAFYDCSSLKGVNVNITDLAKYCTNNVIALFIAIVLCKCRLFTLFTAKNFTAKRDNIFKKLVRKIYFFVSLFHTYFSTFWGAIIKLNASSFDASILYSGRVAGPQLPVPVPFVKPLRVTKVVFWS